MAEEDKKLAASLTGVTDTARSPEGARNVLAMLFPKADQVLETYVSSEQLDHFALKRQRRISQQEFSPTYFRLDPLPVSWSRSELEELFKLGPQRVFEAVEERVSKYLEKDNARLRRLFLDFLIAALSEREAFDAEWFCHLMMISPMYILHRERKPGDLLADDGFLVFNRLLYQVLRPRPPEQRYEIVAQKIDHLEDLSVFTDFFRSAAGDTNPEGVRKKDVLFFGEQTENLRDHLVAIVREFAASDKLWEQISPSRLLWFWWGASHQEEVRVFLSKSMRDPATLRKLLDVCVSPVVSSAGDYERVSRGFEKLVDLKDLEARALQLAQVEPSEENTATVTRFIQALKNSENSRY
jgi:hypothetical protein